MLFSLCKNMIKRNLFFISILLSNLCYGMDNMEKVNDNEIDISVVKKDFI